MSYQPPPREEISISPTVIQPSHTTNNPLIAAAISYPNNLPDVVVNTSSAGQHPPAPTSVPTTSPLVIPHSWSTPLFDCLRDEESCWWSFWCCWVISARNTAEFGLGSPKKQIAVCVGILFLGWFLLFLKFGPLGPLLLIGASVVYVCYRTNNRQQMKAQLHILAGEWMSDCLLHCCCSFCAIAQEARESLLAPRNKRVDYCSAQELSELTPSDDNLFIATDEQERASQSNSQSVGASSNFSSFAMQAGGAAAAERLQSIYFKLSETSQNIVIGLGLFSLIVLILLLFQNPLAVVVLLVVFLQPVVVLYFIYWRGRRKFAQLDYVIKIFCVGFFISTLQSVFFEHILQNIIIFLGVLAFFLIHGASPLSDDKSASDDRTVDDNGQQSFASSWISPVSSSGALFSSALEKMYPMRGAFLYQEQYETISTSFHPYYQSIPPIWQSFVVTLGTSAVQENHHTSSVSSIGLNGIDLLALRPSMSPTFLPTNSSSQFDIDSISRQLIAENIILILVILFLMAFVVAAGVEETMKHFAVRCCRFPAPLKDPNVVLVYLVAGALGFATAENIEYVFGVNSSPIPGTSRFVGELVVLSLRLLMPIHLICAVLQAANLSEVVMGISPNKTIIRVLLPGIVLHGSFDYFLFAIGVIQFAYNIESLGMQIFSMAFPFVITIAGAIWAYRSYTEVEKRYQENWRTISSQEDEVINSML